MLFKSVKNNTFLLFGILLFITGCSSSDPSESTPQDENIPTVETVIENTFTGPDTELIELMESPENQTILGKDEETSTEELETPTELDLYLEELYQSHFTENMYSEYIGVYALSYHGDAYVNDYQMEVDSIEMKQHKTDKYVYDFTAYVQYKKEENEQMIVEISGRAHFSKEGKIAGFELSNDGGLSKALKAEN